MQYIINDIITSQSLMIKELKKLKKSNRVTKFIACLTLTLVLCDILSKNKKEKDE